MSDIKPIEKQATELVERFKKDLIKCAEETISRLYVDLIPHIESDAWLNFRNDVRDEVQKELIADALSTEYGRYSFGWRTRQLIFKEHHDQLVTVINLDHVSEIQRLKEELNKAYSRYV